MDARLSELIAHQQAIRFAGLSGSEARATIRIAGPVLKDAVTIFLASAAAPAVADVTITPLAANHIGVRLKLAKPAFLPSLNLTLAIERQPQLPHSPELILRMTGAGGMMRLAGPAISSFGALPVGVRLEGDRMILDLRAILQTQGKAELLDFAEQLQVLSEEGTIVILVQLRVP